MRHLPLWTRDKKTALSKFTSYSESLRKVVEYKNIWGVKPRNKEQSFALDLLMDEKVPIVSLLCDLFS